MNGLGVGVAVVAVGAIPVPVPVPVPMGAVVLAVTGGATLVGATLVGATLGVTVNMLVGNGATLVMLVIISVAMFTEVAAEVGTEVA